ncbi:hypothetical protein J520_2228 [Acinetobacter sp. 869535]|nr:hypothetical protein J520_2228 [Acinetobacter sp. 869535]
MVLTSRKRSLPYRQLRNVLTILYSHSKSSLPYRQLRKIILPVICFALCSLPYRQLRKSNHGCPDCAKVHCHIGSLEK